MWLSFCFIVTLITIIVYFTIDEPKYSKHQIIKSRPLKFETLLNNNQLDFKATWVSGICIKYYYYNLSCYDEFIIWCLKILSIIIYE